MKLEDGTGSGRWAKVDSENRLRVSATSALKQHSVSEEKNLAFQVSADVAITNSEQNIMLVKNTSDTHNLVVTYLRLQTIGAAAASASAYWNVKLGGDYASGGTALTPTNMFANSAVTATGTFYDGNSSAIVTSGTPVQIDRTYQAANAEVIYDKEGSLILPKNGTLLLTHTGSTVAGQAYCRVSFYYDDHD